MVRDELWGALKQSSKDKFNVDRARFSVEANEHDDGKWSKHTLWHWSREYNGKRLDYWPSRKKYQYGKIVRRGDVYQFMKPQKQNDRFRANG